MTFGSIGPAGKDAPSTERLEARRAFAAAFRALATELDGEAGSDGVGADGGYPLDRAQLHSVGGARRCSAWLVLHSVRRQTRWLDAAAAAADALAPDSVPDDAVAAWLIACCDGWVLKASASFRDRADRLAERLTAAPASVPAWLRYWRITGRRRWLDRALAELQAPPPTQQTQEAGHDLDGDGDRLAARLVAFHGGWRATADVSLRDAAVATLNGRPPGELPPETWGIAADLLDLGPEAFVHGLAELTDSEAPAPDPAALVPVYAALALPNLTLRVLWWLQQELREGPMAEAATYPYPNVRLRYERLPERDQLRIQPVLDGVPWETVEDVGVVAQALEILVDDVDRSPLCEGTRRRRRGPSLLRR